MTNSSPLAWSLARRLVRLCHEHDKNPHLKSLLRNPLAVPYHYDQPNVSELEKAIIKYVYPSPNQIYYRPIKSQYMDILRKVWRMEGDEDLEQEKLDAAFSFIRLLNHNIKNRYDEPEKDDRESLYETLFAEKPSTPENTETTEESKDDSNLDAYNIKLVNNNEISSGMFLVSHPLTRDGPFYKTVIYISEYAKKYGTIGYTINKPLQGRRSGGPISSGNHRLVKLTDGRVALQRSNAPPQYSRARMKLMKRSDEVDVNAIEKDISFVNSTEWTAGQLEHELESGSWFLVSATQDLIFDKCDCGEKLWDDIMKALGGEFEDFVNIRKSKINKKRPRPPKIFSITI